MNDVLCYLVSSLEIENSHVNEENNGSSLVSCSVSIIRSIFKLTEPNLQTRAIGTENLPRLDLSISTRLSSSILSDKKIYNDTLNEQYFTRMITLQRPLTRADHNGTIQCQIESTNNIDVHLVKTVPIDIQCTFVRKEDFHWKCVCCRWTEFGNRCISDSQFRE